jgi:WD40 repeat protein
MPSEQQALCLPAPSSKAKPDSVLTSGLYQWTLTQCQFLFQYTELSAQLDWHMYEAQCKVNAVKSIAELKVLGFMQTGHAAGVSSVNFSPDGKQIVSASWDESLIAIWTEICTPNPIRMPNKSLQTIAC